MTLPGPSGQAFGMAPAERFLVADDHPMVRDALGALAILDYQMIETPDGWQINAVQVLPPPDVGA